MFIKTSTKKVLYRKYKYCKKERTKQKDVELKLLRSSTGASDRWCEIGENEGENEEEKKDSIKVS